MSARWLAVCCALALGCGPEAAPRASAAALIGAEASSKAGGEEIVRPLRVAVIGDLNGGYGARTYGDAVHAAVDRLVSMSPDLVLSTGDMVAGQRRGLDYEGMWAGFHAAVSDRLAESSIPFAVSPGNHDASGYARYEGERGVYVEQWEARRPDVEMVDATHYPLRYSFRVGPALFVALDATTVGPLDAAQMDWLDAQLAATRATVRVVFGHVPLHPFAIGRERETIGDPALEQLLIRHGVDMFVSGHHHAYYPGRRGAMRFVSTACLGGGPRPLIGEHERSARSVLMLEIDGRGVRTVEAYAGERFDERIDRATLPEHIGVLDRDDLMAPRLVLR